MRPDRIVVVGIAALLAAGVAEAQSSKARVARADWLAWESGGPQVGASVRDVDPADAERERIQGGAVLESIRPDGPAARAGMQAADVLIEFDGERVRSARHLARLVRESRPGSSVKATVVRGGRKIEVAVTPTEGLQGGYFNERVQRQMENLADRLSRADAYVGPYLAGRSPLGASVQELTPQLAAYFGAEAGMLVGSVADESPAARAGLRAGDVITTVNGAAVRSRADLVRALRAAEKGTVSIGIVRDKKASTLNATLDEARPRRPLRPIRSEGAASL